VTHRDLTAAEQAISDEAVDALLPRFAAKVREDLTLIELVAQRLRARLAR